MLNRKECTDYSVTLFVGADRTNLITPGPIQARFASAIEADIRKIAADQVCVTSVCGHEAEGTVLVTLRVNMHLDGRRPLPSLFCFLCSPRISRWRPVLDIFPSAAVKCRRPFQRVLALDGRGVPGLAVLPVLRMLERALALHTETAALADAFDWIVGSSVGGIMAVSLRDHRDVDAVQNAIIALLRDEFEAPGFPTARFASWWRKRQTGYRHRGAVFDARIFDRFLVQTMPPGTAVVVHDAGTDVALDQSSGVGVRPALCGTMAEAGFLPFKPRGKRMFASSRNDDPLPAFLSLINLGDDDQRLSPIIISIGTGHADTTVAHTARLVRWQVPMCNDVAFDDTSRKSVDRVLDVNPDHVSWGGAPPDAVAYMLLATTDLWTI